MSFQTGYIALNSQPTNWNQVLSDFQVENCAGEPIDDPVAVMQAVVLNKVMVNVCNAGSIGTGIVQALGEYNEPGLQILTEADATLNLAAGNYHSVSIKVISGSCEITIAGNSYTMDPGESNSWTATKLLNTAITVHLPAAGKVVITTLK